MSTGVTGIQMDLVAILNTRGNGATILSQVFFESISILNKLATPPTVYEKGWLTSSGNCHTLGYRDLKEEAGVDQHSHRFYSGIRKA